MCFWAGQCSPHMAAVMEHALCGVQQLSWPARSPDLSPIEHKYMGHDEAGTYSFSRACQNHYQIVTTGARALDNLSQDDICHLYDCLHARICACIAARGGYTVY